MHKRENNLRLEVINDGHGKGEGKKANRQVEKMQTQQKKKNSRPTEIFFVQVETSSFGDKVSFFNATQ